MFGLFGISSNPLSPPPQHPVITPSAPMRCVAQSGHTKHLTGIVVVRCGNPHAIKRHIRGRMPHAQDSDIRKRIAICVRTPRGRVERTSRGREFDV